MPYEHPHDTYAFLSQFQGASSSATIKTTNYKARRALERRLSPLTTRFAP